MVALIGQPGRSGRAVPRLVAEGADHIKIIAAGGETAGNMPFRPSYTVAELHEAVTAAHELGRLTTAHCRARDSVENALAAGLDCIEHAEFLVPPPEVALGTGRVPRGVTRYDPHLTERLLEQGIFVSFTFQTGGYDTLVDLRREKDSVSPSQRQELDALERAFEGKVGLFQSLL